MRRRIALAVSIFSCFAVPAVALAALATVHLGRLATLSASHLDKDAQVSIAVQPYVCRGANHCGRTVKGTWYTNGNVFRAYQLHVPALVPRAMQRLPMFDSSWAPPPVQTRHDRLGLYLHGQHGYLHT